MPRRSSSPMSNISRSSSRSGVSSSSGAISMGCALCAGAAMCVIHFYLFNPRSTYEPRSNSNFWHPISCPRTDARASAVLPLPLPAPANPAPHRHAGPNPPARTPAFAARQCALLLLPRARSAPALLLLIPAGGIRGLRPPHQRAPRVLREDDTICVLFLPTSTHSTHAVAFPVSPHRSASAPTPTPAPTYISTLSLPTPPGMPPMVWSVSSLRTSPTSGGKPRSSAREKRRSPV
ncbi:hypothetical protein B0H14DRAFT_1688659 [Mycena olivaceomarginata]|nr:hypothetical protein B0H14DRAFT_1688659 [Mycena olivaceomarginata]